MSTPFDEPCPFREATKMRKRLKIMLWGATGVGKTTLALRFPQPVVVDMEGGTDLYGEAFSFHVIQAATADAAENAIKWLHAHDHLYETVVVDPVTIYWAALQDRWAGRFLAGRDPKSKGHQGDYYELQPSDWRMVKNEYKAFMRDLNELDMHTIVTAHEKTLYKGEGQNFMEKLGETFDGEKGTEYLFDVVLRLYIGPGGGRMARTIKDRSNTLPTRDWKLDFNVLRPLLEGPATAGSGENVRLPSEKTPCVSAKLVERIIAQFNLLGVTKEQLETYLDRPLDELIDAEIPALRRLFVELSENKERLIAFKERLVDQNETDEDLTPPPGLELP